MLNSRRLTFQDIEKIPAEVSKDLALTWMEDERDLNDYDYIYGEIIVGGKKCYIIHGFPKDVHGAIFYNDNVYYLGILTGAIIGGIYDRNFRSQEYDEFQEWYNKSTDNSRNYEDTFWTART